MSDNPTALTWAQLVDAPLPASELGLVNEACFLLISVLPLDLEAIEAAVGRPLVQPRENECIVEYASLDHRRPLSGFTVTADWYETTGAHGLIEAGCFGARLAVRWWHPGNAHGGLLRERVPGPEAGRLHRESHAEQMRETLEEPEE